MEIQIATTTGFHLKKLAVGLDRLNNSVIYYTYIPNFRNKKENLDKKWVISFFWKLFPYSALALNKYLPFQKKYVEIMLEKSDIAISRKIKKSSIFIGLSGMSVECAIKAKEKGAIVIIERGSRHVISQNELVMNNDKGLSDFYINRELSSYSCADYISVLSKHSAQSFFDNGFDSNKIFINPLGVDLNNFKMSKKPDKGFNILFVGGWSYRKGVDLLSKAVDRNEKWNLTHIGTVVDVDFPMNHKRIKSLGHKTHKEIAGLMSNFNILVLPSREDGFGMVLLEALASGLPVVASEMTGGPDIKEIIKKPEWIEIVKSGSLESLEKGISRMEEKEKKIEIDRNILTREDKEFFSWDQYVLRYNIFLESIVGD
ncbi:glycosyltransferase family 4 protein [Acinetobacter soli]|uniref:glycosyltransferase family 4 protein n=1 Tax=Acinetobacter soli TaxID=487316 RepID=UPI0032B57E59